MVGIKPLARNKESLRKFKDSLTKFTSVFAGRFANIDGHSSASLPRDVVKEISQIRDQGKLSL